MSLTDEQWEYVANHTSVTFSIHEDARDLLDMIAAIPGVTLRVKAPEAPFFVSNDASLDAVVVQKRTPPGWFGDYVAVFRGPHAGRYAHAHCDFLNAQEGGE